MSTRIADRLAALPEMASSAVLRDALDIWQSGVKAVLPENLIKNKVRWEHQRIVIDESCEIDLRSVRRLIVVGAGKASAAMAAAMVEHVFRHFPKRYAPEIIGWINAPEGTFEGQLPGIRIHAARPAGLNLPTQSAVEGTERIIRFVSEATADDIVLCLLSGGGSALLVAPQPGIALSDKQSVARLISASGGDITQLNTVRSCLSRVKGGGLLRCCNARRMVSLILSDVPGDPVDMIASGPTNRERETDESFLEGRRELEQREEALDCLRSLDLLQNPQLAAVVQWLRTAPINSTKKMTPTAIENVILGNNADAVDAAGVRAVELGYRYVMQAALRPEGDVADVALHSLRAIRMLQEQKEMDCWISGGEPTVKLPTAGLGLGGRNQQLALSVLELLIQTGWPNQYFDFPSAFVSGGTDGEDGPTDAAGAGFDGSIVQRMSQLGCRPSDYLTRADAYHFFSQVGGLIQTGPTGTNVCDLRIALQTRQE